MLTEMWCFHSWIVYKRRGRIGYIYTSTLTIYDRGMLDYVLNIEKQVLLY